MGRWYVVGFFHILVLFLLLSSDEHNLRMTLGYRETIAWLSYADRRCDIPFLHILTIGPIHEKLFSVRNACMKHADQ